MNDNFHNETVSEFRKFLASSGTIPKNASQVIIEKVRSDLNPDIYLVFGKGIVIHGFVATLSLLFCPQFGIGPLGGGHGLMQIFMPLGPGWCALFCGSFFLGLSSIITALLLRPEEVRRACAYGYAYIPTLTALSFMSLMMGGGSATMEIFLFWSAGAVLAGWGLLKLGVMIRLGKIGKLSYLENPHA